METDTKNVTENGIAEIALQKANEQAGLIDIALNHFCKQAATIVISDRAEHEATAAFHKSVVKQIKAWDAERLSIKKPLDVAVGAVQDAFVPKIKKAKEIRDKINTVIVTYENKLKIIAAEQQQKLLEDTRKEEERKRKALEVRAEKWKNKNPAKSEELKEQSKEVHIPVPIVAAPVKVAGLSGRKNYYAEITNFKILPEEYKLADMKRLNDIARGTKREGPCHIPGIVIRSTETKY